MQITKNKKLMVAGIAICFSAMLFVSALISGANLMEVAIDGKVVGYVSSRAEYEQIVEEARESITSQNELGLTYVVFDESKIELRETAIKKDADVPTITSKELVDTLLEKKAVSTPAYAVQVNGTAVASVVNEKDAQAILAQIETAYQGPNDSFTGGFAEEVTVAAVQVNLEDLQTTSAAIDTLLTGNSKENLYEVVEGDTIWDICEQNNISLDEIAAANPDLDPDYIYVGDEILLKQVEPYVHYQTTGIVTTVEPVPFEYIEQESADLYEGETELAQEGVPGEREVTRKQTIVNGLPVSTEEISSAAISDPVAQVVLVGTKARPVATAPAANTGASSSSSGSSGVSSQPGYNSSYSGGSGIVATAYQYLGVPYVYGGSSPSGFDCSGLVQYVYAQNGISIPRTGVAMAGVGTVIPLEDAAPGDVVGWGGPGPGCYHVGIYIGNGQYIHSPYPGTTVSVWSISSYRPDYAIRF